MELHTLGVDGGYTEQDVVEVARCFTGWGINGGSRTFQFQAANHDDGEKVVLGEVIPPGGGVRDGERVIEILAAHPSTARFVATKLARRFVADAPKIDEFLSDEARGFFDAVTSGLDAAGVKWVRAESLVRGLDYYRHTAFEFIPDEGSAAADALGSQSTILGGGRYDGLIESLGGPATPAVGWAAGIERLAMLVGERGEGDLRVAVVAEHASVERDATRLTSLLRSEGLVAEMFASGSPRKRYARAVKANPMVIASLDFRDDGLHQSWKKDGYIESDALDEIMATFELTGEP